MPQWVKRLPCKHGDLSSDSKYPWKTQAQWYTSVGLPCGEQSKDRRVEIQALGSMRDLA